MDTLVRGQSIDGAIRVFSIISTDIVNRAHEIHHTYPVATAALGRLLTGAALMGASLKNEEDSITLQINGDGEAGRIIAVTDSGSNVRGYIENPFIDRPLNKMGKLDVGGAVGKGYMSVVRDLGLKEPYVGQVPLVSGEIAEDLTYYYANSEQIPTAVALGVLVDTDNSCIAAGGFMIQMMPGATDEMADTLTASLDRIESVTSMIKKGMSAQDIIFEVCAGFDMMCSNEVVHPQYKCTCSHERMKRALISLGKDELDAIIKEQGKAELGCQFCDNKYTFSKEELINLREMAK
ncbi:MAG: Hsp33 family molecular chaperone HslO [Clostridiales bacterium]|nr:Hsp33 family molecular chaperone HslO [Clostridiales bacterium]